MKLQLTQHDTTVTIEREGEEQTCDEMAQLCRQLLLGQGYHPSSVTESLPSEHEITEQIGEALEVQRDTDKPLVETFLS